MEVRIEYDVDLKFGANVRKCTCSFPSFSNFRTVIRPARSPVARYSPSALYSTAVIVSVREVDVETLVSK